MPDPRIRIVFALDQNVRRHSEPGRYDPEMEIPHLSTVELVSLSDALSQLEPAAAGKRSMILVKTDQIRVVLVRMTADGHLNEHSAPGRITIHPLSGAFRVAVDGNIHHLNSDSLLTIEHGLVHDVRCVEDGAFLLTIAWHPAA